VAVSAREHVRGIVAQCREIVEVVQQACPHTLFSSTISGPWQRDGALWRNLGQNGEILMTKLLDRRVLLAAALWGLLACQPPASSGPGASSAQRPSAVPSGGAAPARDLSQDEAGGGHILRKHVGRTDEQLLERLNRERNISGASTYTDRATAERAVGAAIAQSQERIQRWLDRTGGHPNLVLDYDSAEPVGRTINRGDSQSRACSHALVVLKYNPPSGYYVLTSYPECR
jgi:CDI toxin RNase A-like protein